MLEASTKTISRPTDIKGRDRKTNEKGVQVHEEAEEPGTAGGKDGNVGSFKLLPKDLLSTEMQELA